MPGSTAEASAWDVLAKVLAESGDDAGAERSFESGLSALEEQADRLGVAYDGAAAFATWTADVYRDYIDFLVARGRGADALHVLERSRARRLLSMLKTRDSIAGRLPEAAREAARRAGRRRGGDGEVSRLSRSREGRGEVRGGGGEAPRSQGRRAPGSSRGSRRPTLSSRARSTRSRSTSRASARLSTRGRSSSPGRSSRSRTLLFVVPAGTGGDRKRPRGPDDRAGGRRASARGRDLPQSARLRRARGGPGPRTGRAARRAAPGTGRGFARGRRTAPPRPRRAAPDVAFRRDRRPRERRRVARRAPALRRGAVGYGLRRDAPRSRRERARPGSSSSRIRRSPEATDQASPEPAFADAVRGGESMPLARYRKGLAPLPGAREEAKAIAGLWTGPKVVYHGSCGHPRARAPARPLRSLRPLRDARSRGLPVPDGVGPRSRAR